ncbi:hypothetical protein [Spiroplasma endosymbiont of Stenodema calcarata]|uniref:hypothetical protein n=1 Tax=Spiroplasma endosymbiont of Stenodema calcarata TaxID=3139328 RepID=UPI003CCB1CC7
MKKLILMATALSMAGVFIFSAIVSKNKSNITDIFRAGQGKNILKDIRIGTISINIQRSKRYLELLFKAVLVVLERQNVIQQLENSGANRALFAINPTYQNDDTSYFIVPMTMYGQQFRLVFRIRDFYLQGVVNYPHGEYVYNYFPDATIQSLDEQDDVNKNQKITVVRSSNYNDLMGDGMEMINFDWSHDIFASFWNVANVNIFANSSIRPRDFGRVIVATAEVMRFRSVRTMIGSLDEGADLTWSDFEPIVRNWSNWTNNAIEWKKIQNLII